MNSGVPPCLGSEFTLAQYSGNCPLFPSSLLLGELHCCAVGASSAVSYSSLPTLHRLSLSLYWVTCRYLTFLAVDWLRTVSASRLLRFCLACCPSSRWSCSFSSFVSPFFLWACGGRCVPSPRPSLSVPFLLVLSLLVCLPPWVFGLPWFVCCTCIPGFFLVVCLAWLFVPLGWCLVFLAVDWSRISSIVPSLPQILLKSRLFPS